MNQYDGNLEQEQKKGVDVLEKSSRRFKFIAISVVIIVICLIVVLIMGVERIISLYDNLITNILELIPIIKNQRIELWKIL